MEVRATGIREESDTETFVTWELANGSTFTVVYNIAMADFCAIPGVTISTMELPLQGQIKPKELGEIIGA